MRKVKVCTIKGCKNKELALGLCSGHYARKRYGKDIDAKPLRKHKPYAPSQKAVFVECQRAGCKWLFKQYPSYKARGWGKYCSVKCRNLRNK